MMNLPNYTEAQAQFLDTLRPLLVSAGSACFVISDAAQDLSTIRYELIAAAVAKGLTGLVSADARGDPSDGLWQLPSDLTAESERWVQGMAASMSVLSRAQQRLFELQVQLFTQRVQNTVDTINKVNGSLASRRVSAHIINFADRREPPPAVAASEVFNPSMADPYAKEWGKKQAVG